MKSLLRTMLPAGLRRRVGAALRERDLQLPSQERIRKWGHRAYVGGSDSESWYGIGKRQYHFLVREGLESHHRFLDVACGSLRLGQYLIPMLDEGHYFGLESEQELIDAGIRQEMLFDIVERKRPSFAVNDSFDMQFCKGYDFAIAQSLFTHLVIEDIERCFVAMRSVARPNSRFYFTFFEGDEQDNPTTGSHANRGWQYAYRTLEDVARASGFECTYIGDWGHERNQVIAVATVGGDEPSAW